jgi:hypothetical protein
LGETKVAFQIQIHFVTILPNESEGCQKEASETGRSHDDLKNADGAADCFVAPNIFSD